MIKPTRRLWILICLLGGSTAMLGLSSGDESPVSESPPLEQPLPEGPLGDTIELGRLLVEQTVKHPLSKRFVGNDLNCTSCHLKNGTDPKAATFIGVATAYPAWSPREQRVITLEDRILNCFMRSCNGIRPPLGSEVSIAIATYITWLSTGQPLKMNGVRSLGPHAVPDLKLDAGRAERQRGSELYADRCASCHGADGAGDEENPPVWGPRSYNEGAGLTDVRKLASWLKVAMPLDDTDLSDQEALDIADYVNSHERPKFRLKDHLPEKDRLGEYNSGSKP
ncbi:c-type cytochrome [Schlesneria sp.]|uniref:c-type cytochrome n=1 Tax=Schlesneria sp. TaxID=2762018 RepID=UPI002EDDCCC6